MSVTCSKNFTLTIGSGRYLYWTLDEVSGVRVDKVLGITLADVAANNHSGYAYIAGAPGLFSNAVTVSNLGFLGGLFQAWIGMGVGEFSAALAHDGIGFSVFGWCKINALDIRFASINYNSVGHGSMELSFSSTSEFFRVYDDATSGQNELIGVPGTNLPVGAWFSFHMFYDGTAGKFGIQINNGAASFAAFTPVITPATAGALQFYILGNAACTTYQADEVLVRLDNRLTQAQCDYLYNGGAGRTWPITLP